MVSLYNDIFEYRYPKYQIFYLFVCLLAENHYNALTTMFDFDLFSQIFDIYYFTDLTLICQYVRVIFNFILFYIYFKKCLFEDDCFIILNSLRLDFRFGWIGLL